MNFKGRSAPERIGFQLAPMIDIMFLLLCFFVATQIYAQWESEIDITLPVATTGDLPSRLPVEIIINIKGDGALVVNKREFDQPGLRRLLGRVAAIYPSQPVIIRADKQTAYQHVIGVLDSCRACRIGNISFATSLAED
jgi:biopolymer transport protein ExbD